MVPIIETKILNITPSEVKFENNRLQDILYGEPTLISAEASEVLNEAFHLLNSDQVVAIPTETVYGLSANAYREESVKKIFQVKGRPSDNPLIVHVSNLNMLACLLKKGRNQNELEHQQKLSKEEIFSIIPSSYHQLILQYWPGPLTLILPTSEIIPNTVTAGHSTVAIRFPSHPVTRALIQRCGFPLAAPSANLSGRPSPTKAEHVFHDLHGKLQLILDAGSCESGVESTVVDALRNPPAILRPGGITYEMIKPFLHDIVVYSKDFVDKNLEKAPTTPGMKYKHYTPNGYVVLMESIRFIDEINALLSKKFRDSVSLNRDDRVGIMGSKIFIETCSHFIKKEFDLEIKNKDQVWSIGDEILNPQSFAQDLFHCLRSFEKLNCSYILIQGIDEEHEGLAVMNRLRKAASLILLP